MENKKYDAELTHLFAHHSVAESTPYEVLDKAYSEYGHTVCVLALYQLLTTGRKLTRAMEHPAALVETITGVFPPDVKESAAEVMLIVVAIIAVLVAIAIPVFNGALTKSKEAADVANIRALYAEWQVGILTENKAIPTSVDAFLTSPDNGEKTTLNYPGNFTKVEGKDTFQYAAKKLTDGNGDGGKTYSWTLASATFNG